MVYAVAIIMGIFAGLLLKGRMSNLLNFKIRQAWLLVAAFILQASSQLTAVKGFDFAIRYSLLINIAVFCMVFAVLWLNRKYYGIVITGAGCFLNALVMTANGGKMPVSKELLLKEQLNNIIAIYEIGGDGKHILAGESTRLALLGDVIAMPGRFGYIAKFVSLGDIFIAFGLFVLITEIIIGKKLVKSESNAL